MNLPEISERVRRQAPAFRQTGVTSVFVFGSRARGDYREDSDLDLFVDYDALGKPPSYFKLIEIENQLSDELGIAVSITTKRSLHPLMRNTIEREAIRIILWLAIP